MNFELSFVYSGFQGIFGILTVFAWFAAFLFSIEYMKNDIHVIRYYIFNLLTLGATLGIFFAEDLFTLFVFFEIMSFTSFMWVAHRQTKESLYAAGTYLGIAIAGGMAILMGLFIVYDRLGTLVISDLAVKTGGLILSGDTITSLYAAAGCMFAGFAAKAGAFPVHVWLAQSYTEAPSPETALLSAILSKTGVFGIVLITACILPFSREWGMFVLIIGVITMVLGGIRGLMSNNFKTTIAYSSMSQIGLIFVGIGMQGLYSEILSYPSSLTGIEQYHLAVDGTLLHMVNHVFVKLVLFLIAGVVLMQTGSLELNKVRGFGRKKPFLLVTFLLAAAGIGGVPLLNGYVSKALLHESIVEYTALVGGGAAFKSIEYLLVFSGGLTVAYMIKLFVVLFLEKNEDARLQAEYEAKKNYASLLSRTAIAVCALPILLIGLIPNISADKIAEYGQDFVSVLPIEGLEKEPVNYFSLANLSGALVSIVIGVVVYFLIVRLLMLRKKEAGYRDIFPVWLDMEKYVYRAVFYTAIPAVLGIISRILDSIVDTFVVFLRKTVYCDRKLPYELPEGNFVTHSIGRGMEIGNRLYCKISKKEYKPKEYEHKLALKNTDFFENLRIIERSLSFGLLMFCLGLGLTMIYLLVVN